MAYYNTRTVDMRFDDAVNKVTEELKKEGFGVLTEIDVKETLQKKLNVDFRKYKILGACNPPFAYKALSVEDKIGTLLPCNIIVQEKEDGQVEVSAINPIQSLESVNKPELEDIASEIAKKLINVLENI